MLRRVWLQALALVVTLGVLVAPSVYADTLASPNYRFDESTVGAGGLVQSSSANYQGGNTLGDIAVGDASSSNYQITSPARNGADPALAVEINSPAANFGNFSATTASTATASFSVSNYTSYGYVVQVTGNAPANGTDVISPLSTETASNVGHEQFGMNLVANTSPSSVGSNPAQTIFGVGAAAAGYNTPNKFKFNSGDVVAAATKSSGKTTYTISYLVNVAPLTHGGIYKGDQTIIVTGTY